MKYIFVFLPILFAACQGSQQAAHTNRSAVSPDSATLIKTDTAQTDQEAYNRYWKNVEVMDVEDIIFNGKHRQMFSLKEYNTIYGKPDSTQLIIELEECPNYFFEDTTSQYYYKEGLRFERSQEKMRVDNFKFTNQNYILFKGIKLSGETTMKDMRKLFPNAMKNISGSAYNGQPMLEDIALREDKDNLSEGHVVVVFNNKKLYMLYWWSPC